MVSCLFWKLYGFLVRILTRLLFLCLCYLFRDFYFFIYHNEFTILFSDYGIVSSLVLKVHGKENSEMLFQNISSWTSLVYESDNYKHDFYQTLVLVFISVALKASINHSQLTEKYFPWKLINLEASFKSSNWSCRQMFRINIAHQKPDIANEY